VNAHPKGKFGAPGYDLAQFGLDAGELAERFSGYIAVPPRVEWRTLHPSRAFEALRTSEGSMFFDAPASSHITRSLR